AYLPYQDRLIELVHSLLGNPVRAGLRARPCLRYLILLLLEQPSLGFIRVSAQYFQHRCSSAAGVGSQNRQECSLVITSHL
ncbi:MAG: hypothetical protein ACREDR_07150, partial [Blastocatellia bacterium]